jgi:hypothetical protein
MVALLLTGACAGRTETPASDYSSIFADRWYEGLQEIVKEERLSPPAAARVFGYTGVALYEALQPGMPGYNSLAGQLNGLGDLTDLVELPDPTKGAEYHWPTVANSAIAAVLQGLFATASARANEDIKELKEDGEELFEGTVDWDDAGEEVLARSRTYGAAVGNFIYQWSLGDGYTTLRNCQYPIPFGQGVWEPTPPAFAAPLEPCWGRLRPFALKTPDEFLPPPPPPFSTGQDSEMYRLAKEVYEAKNGLTAEQRGIAIFWADNPGETATPPGHSLAVTTQWLEDRDRSLAQAAEAYAKVGIAVADAFISCWNTKYHYNLLRPVTYIQDYVDPAWTPLINTPPFPEYTSGHSVQSAAAAEILTSLFGREPFDDRTHEDRGFVSRQFLDFDGWAQEAAMSRLYAGIHYRPAIEAGLAEGRAIGKKVNALKFKG